MMEKEELAEMEKRICRYLALGFPYDDIFDKKLYLDDELWERVRNTPVKSWKEQVKDRWEEMGLTGSLPKPQ
jgi:hypothetical protein